MGSLGSIVIPLVVAAVIGFVAGWFFARTGERTESAEPDLVSVGRLSGSDESTGALSDAESATFDRRLAQLEADYSQRSDTFVKREAELTAAGRKLVEQLRHRERELGVLREQHEALDAEAVPVEAVDSEPVDVEPADVAEVAAGSESVPPPVLAISVEPSQIRSRRRSVIDPATGLPLGAEPTVSESTANVDDPQMIGSSPTGESDIQHGGVAKPDPQPPRLSVRMVGPRASGRSADHRSARAPSGARLKRAAILSVRWLRRVEGGRWRSPSTRRMTSPSWWESAQRSPES